MNIQKLTLAAGLAMFTPMVLAAGFQINEFGVKAEGRANAGEPAMADSAAAMARNSAVLTEFDQAEISLVYHYIDPDIDVEGTNQLGPVTNDASKKDIAPAASVPGFYYVQPINEHFAFGLSLNSYYGLSTDYGDNYAGSEFANQSSIKTYALTPRIAAKVSDNLSFGLGISYIYGRGKLENTVSATGSVSGVPQGTPLLSMQGSGDKLAYDLGVLWKLSEHTRLGLRYQSGVRLELDGDVDIFANPPGAVQSSTGTLEINLPASYEIGLAHDVNDNITLLFGAQKTAWHTFESLSGTIKGIGDVNLKDEDWGDAWRYSIGGDFKVTKLLALRAGLALDKTPVKSSKRSLSIPDADRQWLTLGASFDFEKAGSLDLSFVYLHGDKVKVNETSDLTSQFTGKLSSTNAMIYSVGYNIRF